MIAVEVNERFAIDLEISVSVAIGRITTVPTLSVVVAGKVDAEALDRLLRAAAKLFARAHSAKRSNAARRSSLGRHPFPQVERSSGRRK
jgi:hypothetical protein